MKRKMIGFLTMALTVSAVGTLGSCKDYDDDNRVELQGEYANLKKQLQELTAQLGNCCNDFKDEVNGKLDAINEQLNGKNGEKGALEKLQDDIDKLNASINGEDGVSGINGQINQLVTNYTNVLADVSALQTALTGKLDASTFNSAKTEITDLITDLQNSITSNNSEFNSKIADLQGQLDVLNNIDYADLQARIEALEGKECPQGISKAEVENLIKQNNVLLNQAIANAVSAIQGDTNATIADVQASLTATDQKYADKIDSLENAINKEVDALKAQLGSLVTSVLVQGTYNPIFGSLTAPFNVQSNVLAAYYGKAEVEGSFPFANPGMLVNDHNSLSAKDKAMIGAAKNAFDFSEGQTLIDGEGNAGTIYLTINPTAVNFKGLKFRLENSLGEEESPVKLGELTPSKKILTFGWTRGASANGFYEATATVAEKDIQNAKLVVDMTKSDVQEIFKDITSPRDGIDIMNIANKVYSVVNGVCEANAVKAYWGTDANANSTLSQYSIAATAVKPLSFAFMSGYHIDSFYGVDRVKNFINNTIDGINISINIGDGIVVPEIKKIEIKPFEGGERYKQIITIDDEITVDGINYELDLAKQFEGQTITVDVIDNGIKVGEAKIEVSKLFGDKLITITTDPVTKEIHIEKEVDFNDMIEEVYGEITDPIKDVNEMLGDLEKFMDDVNDMLEQINEINTKIEDAKQSVADQINKYIDALNKKLCGAVNSIHDRLQPLAIAHNGKEFYTLSGIKNNPSKVSGNTLHIVPTTYTAELVVPVFKKYVAVTNVFKGSASAQGGDDACLNALKAANNKGGMNTVVAGTTRDVEFVGEKGYIYEIAYSALDYSGKAVTKKYYVTVTE